MIRRNSVENQIERASGGGHAGFVGGNDELRGAQLQSRVLFGRRGGNSRDFVAHGRRQSDAHLAQTPDPDDPDAKVALQCPPMSQRGIKRNSRAKHRTSRFDRIILGNSE